jgi:hypothetical protein
MAVWVTDHHDAIFNLDPCMWTEIARRPDAWNGQGLPPVGVACEYMRGDVPHISQDWEEVIPLAFGSKLAFLRYAATGNEFTEKVYRCAFRPIRTQAQIAADERIATIESFMRDLCISEKLASVMFDQGYRKQPAKQDGE